MASIKDVARASGVSIATISRAINNRDGINAETRERVLNAVRELGYRPNLVAQNLRGKRGRVIGLVVPDDSISFSSLMHFTMLHARERGYSVIFGTTENDAGVESDFLEKMIQLQIDGVIFSRVSDESRFFDRVNGSNVPAVIVDRTIAVEGLPSVTLDNVRAGEVAGEYLASLGHRVIGCIQGPSKISLVRERLDGFARAINDAGLSLATEHLLSGDFRYESGMRAMQELLKQPVRPTAVWAQNDLMAYGAIKAAREHGLKVPDDISVLGMDDIQFSKMMDPALTTVHYPFEEMARAAVDRIIDLIEHVSDGPRSRRDEESLKSDVKLEPTLVIRDSCKAMAADEPPKRK